MQLRMASMTSAVISSSSVSSLRAVALAAVKIWLIWTTRVINWSSVTTRAGPGPVPRASRAEPVPGAEPAAGAEPNASGVRCGWSDAMLQSTRGANKMVRTQNTGKLHKIAEDENDG